MAIATDTIPVSHEAAQMFVASPVETQREIQYMVSNAVREFVYPSLSGEGNRALYEEDFYDWTQQTAALIRAGHWGAVNREALAEEVESLGISQKHALGSHLKNLVMHLLKWHYQPSGHQTGHSWQSSIINARDEIAMILEDSHHRLQSEVPGLLARRYPAARMLAYTETGLPLSTFPETCPWTGDQVLKADFWPEEERTS